MVVERKFPVEFELKLDNHLEHIENKSAIMSKVDSISDEETLGNIINYYIKRLELNPTISEVDIKEIIDKIKERQEFLKNSVTKQDFGTKLETMKKDARSLENISLIEPNEFDNDKIDGVRKNSVYLKFVVDSKTEIYEVENIGAVNNLVNGDIDIIKNMSEKEIMEYLKKYSKKCDVLSIDERTNNDLNSDVRNEEYKKVTYSHALQAFMSEENAVLKERVDMKHYIEDYMDGETITFALNSQGERIYLVGDKTFKFVGDDERTLKEIKTDGKVEDNVQTSNFNENKRFSRKVKETPVGDYANLNDYVDAETELSYIIEGIEYDLGVTDNQIEFLCNFLMLGVNCEATEELEFPGDKLEELYNKYMSLIGTHPKYSNSVIEEIVSIREGKTLNNEIAKNNNHVKKLEYKPKLDDLSNEKSGFISVLAIMEVVLTLGLIFSLIVLVKR